MYRLEIYSQVIGAQVCQDQYSWFFMTHLRSGRAGMSHWKQKDGLLKAKGRAGTSKGTVGLTTRCIAKVTSRFLY